MSLEQTPQLSELRLRMASLLKRRAQVERSTALHPLLDECIRQAFHDIVSAADWAPLRVEETISLTQGVHGYEIPDGIPPGWIEDPVCVIRAEDNKAYPLNRGIDTYDREAYSISKDNPGDLTTNAGRPEMWAVWDSRIQIYPAPDTTKYSKLRFWAKTKPSEPWAEEDRSYVDGSVHLRMALFHYYIDSDPNTAIAHRNSALSLLRDLSTQQQPGSIMVVGPARTSRHNQSILIDPSVKGVDNWDPFAAKAYRQLYGR